MIDDGPEALAAKRAFGILGGTFDPIHAGHLALAHEARAALDLEYVLFVPNADPPHKQDQTVTAASHREAMVAAAIAGEPGFVLSRIELERDGPSYAVDTVAELAAQSRSASLPDPWFILSAEALAEFHTWREPLRILELCRVAVAPRAGMLEPDAAWLREHYPGFEDRFTFLPGPHLDVASTAIRGLVAAGQPIDRSVPASVADYIVRHDLYHEQEPGKGGSAVDIEHETIATDLSEVDDGADPRQAARPGLPSSRTEAADAEEARLTVIPGVVDESVLALAHLIVELASDKKATDTVLLDVRGQTTMTDYFVITTGASDRQLSAIADGIEAGAKETGWAPISREGDASSHWLLVDYGGVIVHVMSGPEREFYQLEKLWADASLLLRVL